MTTAALRVEWWKFRRSRVVQVASALMGLMLPGMGLAFYSVAVNGGVGAVADKASAFLTGEGWVGYLGMVDQIAAVAMFLGIGVVVAWAFGREHSDRTFPSLFALPTSLRSIAGAKFVVLVSWIVLLAFGIALVSFAFGLAAGVGPVEVALVGPELLRLIGIAGGAGMLSLTMGFVSSVGRGYLPAIGAMAVVIAISQVAVLFGTGGWFPFAVPGLLAVAGAEGAPDLVVAQLALVPIVAVIGIWLTMSWWAGSEVV